MEALWPKRRILEVYLNVAEFDEGVFGAEAAARRHFGVSAADLTQVQAARLAAVLPAPQARSASQPGPFVRDQRRRDSRRRSDDPSRRARCVLCEFEFQPGFSASSPTSRSKGRIPHDTPLPLRALSFLPQGPAGACGKRRSTSNWWTRKYWEPSTEFLRRNPAGKVPILKIDGLTLTESGAICEYIEETRPRSGAHADRSARTCRGAAPGGVVRRQVPSRR